MSESVLEGITPAECAWSLVERINHGWLSRFVCITDAFSRLRTLRLLLCPCTGITRHHAL